MFWKTRFRAKKVFPVQWVMLDHSYTNSLLILIKVSCHGSWVIWERRGCEIAKWLVCQHQGELSLLFPFWLYLLTFSRIFHYHKKHVGIYLFSCVIFFNIPRSWHGWNIFFCKWCCVAFLFYHFIYIDHKFSLTFCFQPLSFSRSFVSKSYLQQVDREERPDVDKVRKMHAMEILIYSSITP